MWTAGHNTGLFNLEIGREDLGRERDKDYIARTLVAFHQTLLSTQPIAVVLPFSDVTAPVVGAANAATEFGTPILLWGSNPAAQTKWGRSLRALADEQASDAADAASFMKSIAEQLRRQRL